MKYDKELINSRIESMKDPVQKIILQDVLKDVFQSIMDYSESCFNELEAKIDAEIKDSHEKYYIYTAVCKKDGIDATSSFLYEMNTISQKQSSNILDTIFLACDFNIIHKCIGQTFQAVVETEEQTYHIKTTLKYAEKYLLKIEWLYQQFQANQKQWQTINCPYLYKFVDIIDVYHIIPTNETVKSVSVDLGNLMEYVHKDIVMIWNVKELEAETMTEIIPGNEIVLYEHKVDIPLTDTGYLVTMEDGESFYTIYNQECLIVRTENKGYENLNLLQINKFDLTKDNTKLLYPLQTNKRHMSHIDRQAINRDKFIFTYSEIERMLNSYEVYRIHESLTLESINLAESWNQEIIDCNSFIPQHKFLDKRRILMIRFRLEKREGICFNEIIFFLVSEIQLCIQEYRCVADIIEVEKFHES